MNHQNNKTFDVIVLGSGIAGISLGSELSNYLDVCVLEKEKLTSYHSTGRSIAFYIESYGSEEIRKLTTASKEFFYDLSKNNLNNGILKKTGMLHIANKNQKKKLQCLYNNLIKINKNFTIFNKLKTIELLPCLNEKYIDSSIYDSEASEIDIHPLYNFYLKKLKKNNGKIITDIQTNKFIFNDNKWKIITNSEDFNAKIVVNAAGAWCDLIAENIGTKKINLIPKKRTVFCFKPINTAINNEWPLANDIEENFYFKIDNNTVIASPEDETPTVPHDAQPDDYDIAIGIDRIKNATNFNFNTILNKWAGLRSFVKDNNPVIGFDSHINNFFWFAGQGGYGIQIAPALAKIASNIILNKNNEYFKNQFQINLNSLHIKRFN
ncbi:hypothetical protein CMO94_02230 [Candidatus Woesearchaeota archaeon]|jgi:D-arginine dehydrogenase|nr:hypothetical protein [Candidatus Woesearchaeota archaeon]|tara:strand:+ start:1216 stop:2355 length:1140 start_codon:yes stop_codon:yes gene_type:complete